LSLSLAPTGYSWSLSVKQGDLCSLWANRGGDFGRTCACKGGDFGLPRANEYLKADIVSASLFSSFFGLYTIGDAASARWFNCLHDFWFYSLLFVASMATFLDFVTELYNLSVIFLISLLAYSRSRSFTWGRSYCTVFWV